MALEFADCIHAAMGISFDPAPPAVPTSIVIRACAGVVLESIELVAPGVIECDLVDGMGQGEVIVGVSARLPDGPYFAATVMRNRISDTRWRFTMFRAGGPGVENLPTDFDVVWFRAALGADPIATIPVGP